MMPANQSESDFVDVVGTLMERFQDWVKQEIVDDDPWDQESLYSDTLDAPSETSDTWESSASDRS